MSSGVEKQTRSEDVLGKKLDRCVADTILKTAGGAAVGIVFSVVLAKRRTWPVWLGAGVGLGMGLANAQNDLRNPFLLHGRKIKACCEKEAAAGNVIVVKKGELEKQNK